MNEQKVLSNEMSLLEVVNVCEVRSLKYNNLHQILCYVEVFKIK